MRNCSPPLCLCKKKNMFPKRLLLIMSTIISLASPGIINALDLCHKLWYFQSLKSVKVGVLKSLCYSKQASTLWDLSKLSYLHDDIIF